MGFLSKAAGGLRDQAKAVAAHNRWFDELRPDQAPEEVAAAMWRYLEPLGVVSQATFGLVRSARVGLMESARQRAAAAGEVRDVATEAAEARRLQLFEWLGTVITAGVAGPLPPFPVPKSDDPTPSTRVLPHLHQVARESPDVLTPVQNPGAVAAQGPGHRKQPRPNLPMAPIRCQDCRHYRPYRAVTVVLEAELRRTQNLGTIAEQLTELTRTERQAKGTEARLLFDRYRLDLAEWGSRPWFFAYCGVLEQEGRYFIAPVKNADYRCGDFEARPPGHGTNTCATCANRVLAPRWSLDGEFRKHAPLMLESMRSDLSSTYSFAIGKSRQRVEFEVQQVFDTRGVFATEPECFEYCRAHSDPERREYRICALENVYGVCGDWETGDPQISDYEREARATEVRRRAAEGAKKVAKDLMWNLKYRPGSAAKTALAVALGLTGAVVAGKAYIDKRTGMPAGDSHEAPSGDVPLDSTPEPSQPRYSDPDTDAVEGTSSGADLEPSIGAPAEDAAGAARLSGAIEWYYADKSYGLIRSDTDGNVIYFYDTSPGDLGLSVGASADGLRVEFSRAQGRHGLVAERVRPLRTDSDV